MIDELKPYAEYKDSGLSWLGKVPEHWGMPPGFAAFREKCVKNEGMQEDTVLSLSYGRIVVKPKDKLHGLVPESFETYQIVAPGDIIVRSTDLQNDWNSMRVGLVRARGIITSAYLCFQVISPLSPEYAHALLHTFDLMKVFYGLGSGLRQNLSFIDFKRMLILTPPPDEQAAIVKFLDYANGKIERAIRAKRKLIGLLNEQKQAIIHRAVTRGLDPNVKLKPSGIPWLGDVPEHWRIERTKNVFRLRTEKSGVAHGKELLSIYTHIGVRPRKDLEQKGNKASTTDGYWIVHQGDLIVNKLLAWMGAVGSSEYEGVTSPAYDILKPIHPLCSQYYHYLFRTKLYLQQFKQRSRGIMDMRLRLYFDQLGQLPLLIPPVEEQTAIVEFYNQTTAGLTRAIDRTEREIDLLREYRTTLTAEVVTGKLDVREAAKRLPDQADEPLPPDDSMDELIDDEIAEEVEA